VDLTAGLGDLVMSQILQEKQTLETEMRAALDEAVTLFESPIELLKQ